jgi:hypothetical protein
MKILVLSDLHIDTCDNSGIDVVYDFGIDHCKITNSQGQTIYIEHGYNNNWFNVIRFGLTFDKFGISLMKKMSHSKLFMDKETMKYELIKESKESIKNSYIMRYAINFV